MDSDRERTQALMLDYLTSLTVGAKILIVPDGVRDEDGFRLRWSVSRGMFRPHKDPKEDGPVVASEPATTPPVKEPGPQVETPGLTRQLVVVGLAGSRQSVTEEEGRSPRYSERCAGDILALLRETERRYSQGAIADEFARRGLYWSLSVIEGTTADMRKRGELDNDRDSRGRGFGLPAWSEGNAD